jgi:isopentenyldiphosphate isomerase
MLVSIVDENDVEIGVKDRNDLLKDDIQRVSCVWITDSDGRYLLAQRALTKKHSPGKWGPAAAGTVELGETYESNIVKEIQEELGIVLSLEELREGPKILCRRESSTYLSQWYFAVVDKELNEFSFPEDEVMALSWYTRDELETALKEKPEDFLTIIHEHKEKVLSNGQNLL